MRNVIDDAFLKNNLTSIKIKTAHTLSKKCYSLDLGVGGTVVMIHCGIIYFLIVVIYT